MQVMEEGERLSKKQLAQENTIKKLRAELAEARSEKGSTSASLASERQKVTHMSPRTEHDGESPALACHLPERHASAESVQQHRSCASS